MVSLYPFSTAVPQSSARKWFPWPTGNARCDDERAAETPAKIPATAAAEISQRENMKWLSAQILLSPFWVIGRAVHRVPHPFRVPFYHLSL